MSDRWTLTVSVSVTVRRELSEALWVGVGLALAVDRESEGVRDAETLPERVGRADLVAEGEAVGEYEAVVQDSEAVSVGEDDTVRPLETLALPLPDSEVDTLRE